MREPARCRAAESRHVLDARDGQPRERLRERAPPPPEQHRRNALVRVERIARRAATRLERQRIDRQVQRLVMEKLVDRVGHRADVWLAHHDAPARRQHARRFFEEFPRRRQVMDHVEQHERADAAIVERHRLGVDLTVEPRRAHQIGQLHVGNRVAGEPGARSQLDPPPAGPRRQLARDPPVQRRIQHAESPVLGPHAPVPFEPLQRLRLQRLAQRRRGLRIRHGGDSGSSFRRNRHTNLILRAAIADIRSSSMPCRQRSMFVVP